MVFNTSVRPDPAPDDPVLGGRFDARHHGVAYLYAAHAEEGALAEALVRDLGYTATGARPLPPARVRGRVSSALTCAREVRLVVVHGAGAQQIGQDDWLTRCDETNYPVCRRWAEAIRGWRPDVDGLTWRSKRDREQRVRVLWGPTATAAHGCGFIEPSGPPPEPIDAGAGLLRLKDFLTAWRLYLE